MVQTQRMTAEEFDQFVERPENADRLFEYIEGEIVEVVSNNYSSLVAMRIGARILLFVEEHSLGYVTGEAGGYAVAGQRYIPDVGFISKAKQPEPSHATYNPNPPDLAVEVLSPTDVPRETRIKVINYLAAGTTIWVVDPESKQIEIYTPGPHVETLDSGGVLDGGAVLPGFKLPVRNIFSE